MKWPEMSFYVIYKPHEMLHALKLVLVMKVTNRLI